MGSQAVDRLDLLITRLGATSLSVLDAASSGPGGDTLRAFLTLRGRAFFDPPSLRFGDFLRARTFPTLLREVTTAFLQVVLPPLAARLSSLGLQRVAHKLPWDGMSRKRMKQAAIEHQRTHPKSIRINSYEDQWKLSEDINVIGRTCNTHSSEPRVRGQ